MSTIHAARTRAMDAIVGMERSARISAQLGPEYGVTLQTKDLNEFIGSCRILVARDSAAEVAERALCNRWSFVCFVMGIFLGLVLR